ncbi:G-protein coupled receptor 12-like isoform X1 [Lates japonicus]|uniref:G-protein coupled receptor 12-like isoform X1 n=1 Tax=Lates japonicus TaxID=270547 RepID=A0AAD3RLN6_LATJO|nr:G-protein coupled receptor 12-like isoform X1 [Lates japonicus]
MQLYLQICRLPFATPQPDRAVQHRLWPSPPPKVFHAVAILCLGRMLGCLVMYSIVADSSYPIYTHATVLLATCCSGDQPHHLCVFPGNPAAQKSLWDGSVMVLPHPTSLSDPGPPVMCVVQEGWFHMRPETESGLQEGRMGRKQERRGEKG